MTSKELKITVIDKISNIDNDVILLDLLNVINSEKDLNNTYEIPLVHKEMIEIGLSDESEGKVMSHKIAMEKISKCLEQ